MFANSMLLADVMSVLMGFLPVVIFLLVTLYVAGERKLKEQRLAQRKQALLNQSPAERQRQAAATRAPRPVRNEEIEEFLRRAAQQRAGAAAAQRAGAGRAPATPERMTGSAPAARPAKPIAETKSSRAQRSQSSLSKGVNARLSTKQFEARASDLTGDISRLDQEREQRMKRTFDHQLGAGQLGSLGNAASQAASQAAAVGSIKPNAQVGAGLMGLLTGGSLQQAYVLSEIFRRPEERW